MAKEASLDDCLKLLQGDSDEQRLVGLLLATKFVKGDDFDAVRKLFETIGFQFINRLIKTGSGQVRQGKDKQQSYLHLALSILSAFCRLPELASSDEIIAKVPLFATTLGSKQNEAAAEDCYECLLAVTVSSEKGLQSMLDCRLLTIVAHQLHDSAPDAPWIPVALKLLHSLLVGVAAQNRIMEYAQDLTYVIPPVATQLSFQQDIIKFEALSILYTLLVSDISTPIRAALGDSVHHSQWPEHTRTGLGQILHSRVVIEQKYLVLELAESIVELLGNTWLVGFMELPGQQGHAPRARFFLLIVETLRVETAVLLNEVAQTTFDPDQVAEAQTSGAADTSAGKQRRLMKCFALLEYVINVVATQAESSKEIDESTLQKTIIALDEVVGVVLEFIDDAQGHHQSQGDVLFASVHIVSRYLAEAPLAHKQRVRNLVHFLLSVSTANDNRPFLAVQCMLPFLTQITLDLDGCKALLASRSHIQIVNFLSWASLSTHGANGALVDICDILLNLLRKEHKLIDGASIRDFVPVLPALVAWVGQGVSKMENSMVACVFTAVLALINEDDLRHIPDLGTCGLQSVFQVILLNVDRCFKEDGSDEHADEDLLEILLSGSAACVERHPSFRLDLKAWAQQVTNNRAASQAPAGISNPSFQQLLMTVL